MIPVRRPWCHQGGRLVCPRAAARDVAQWRKRTWMLCPARRPVPALLDVFLCQAVPGGAPLPGSQPAGGQPAVRIERLAVAGGGHQCGATTLRESSGGEGRGILTAADGPADPEALPPVGALAYFPEIGPCSSSPFTRVPFAGIPPLVQVGAAAAQFSIGQFNHAWCGAPGPDAVENRRARADLREDFGECECRGRVMASFRPAGNPPTPTRREP